MGLSVLDTRLPNSGPLVDSMLLKWTYYIFVLWGFGNKLSDRYIVTNLSLLNIVINPSFLKLYASALDF